MSIREWTYDDWLVEEEDRRIKQRQLQRWMHPDCNDPAHPGCSRCVPEDDDTDTEAA